MAALFGRKLWIGLATVDIVMAPDNHVNRMAAGLGAEKQAQIGVAKVVLKPVIWAADLAVFALCFRHFKLGLALSIGAAVVAHFAILIVVVFPIGYVLGKRSAQRRQRLL